MAAIALVVGVIGCAEPKPAGISATGPVRASPGVGRAVPGADRTRVAPEASAAGQAGKAAPKIAEPPAEALLAADLGESKAAGKVISVLSWLRDSVVETRYQARTQVRAKEGFYGWDCSGMASWILRRSAPRARRAMKKSRPVARDFYKIINRAPTKRARRGWRRLGHVSDARPGDLFAWLRSPASTSKVTGHVGFFVDTPQPHPDYPDIYVARIVDATSLPHGDDTRPRDGEGGFGFGTMLFAIDADGETIGYGWHGLRSLEWGFMPARVIYGRVTK